MQAEKQLFKAAMVNNVAAVRRSLDSGTNVDSTYVSSHPFLSPFSVTVHLSVCLTYFLLPYSNCPSNQYLSVSPSSCANSLTFYLSSPYSFHTSLRSLFLSSSLCISLDVCLSISLSLFMSTLIPSSTSLSCHPFLTFSIYFFLSFSKSVRPFLLYPFSVFLCLYLCLSTIMIMSFLLLATSYSHKRTHIHSSSFSLFVLDFSQLLSLSLGLFISLPLHSSLIYHRKSFLIVIIGIINAISTIIHFYYYIYYHLL